MPGLTKSYISVGALTGRCDIELGLAGCSLRTINDEVTGLFRCFICTFICMLNRHMVVTILRRCGLSLVRQAVVLVYQLMKQIVIICKAKVGIELRVELG